MSQKTQVCLLSMELAVKQKHFRVREGHMFALTLL